LPVADDASIFGAVRGLMTGDERMARDQRRLAAIVAADVAGYSRLMGKDESATLATLKAHRRELIDPKITEYGGRIVKTTGDGLLLEFPSVVDAVRCAVDMQRGMAQRNADVPADRAIAFRIGINVGDIIIDGDDIFGDGVNVAARLETLAEPGGICVSRVVRDQVLDKLSFAFDDLGPQEVKNIVRPVEVFRVALGPDVPSAAVLPDIARRHRGASRRRATWVALSTLLAIGLAAGAWTASRQFTRPTTIAPYSIQDRRMTFAVLPVDAPAGDADAIRLAGDMTDAVTTAQEARTRWAQVVPRRSVEEALARHTGTRDLGAALNVHFLLRGNVSRASAGYTGELFVIDAATERILDKRTLSIASTTLAPRYTPEIDNALGWLTYQALRLEVQRARDKPLEELDVRDLAFRAYVDWGSNPEQDPKAAYTSATQLLNRALALSPDDLALYLTRRRISATASTAGRETSPSSRRSERQHSIGISGAIPTLLRV
jgi:class 3 adenylate cyclase/TolB-like protein